MCVAPAVGVSWYWPPGRTYKSPEKALGFSHVSLARCRSICSQSPLIELETESLEAPLASPRVKRGRRGRARVARKRKRETIASRESKTRSEEIILHSSRVYQHQYNDRWVWAPPHPLAHGYQNTRTDETLTPQELQGHRSSDDQQGAGRRRWPGSWLAWLQRGARHAEP